MEQNKRNQLVDDLEILFEEKEDCVRQAERQAIRADFISEKYLDLEEKVINYIAKYSAGGPLHEQFYLYYEVQLARWRGEEAPHICQLAERALELTKATGEIPDCKEMQYTYTELELLMILIECRHENWRDPFKCEIGLLKIIQYARLYFDKEKCENIENRAWQVLLADAQGPA